MKYVYRHEKTKAKLKESPWTHGCEDLALVGCFFNDRGNDDQKSREGMLRSILYQVLDTRRDLIPEVFSQWKFFEDLRPKDPEHQLNIPGRFLHWDNLSNAFVSVLDHLRGHQDLPFPRRP